MKAFFPGTFDPFTNGHLDIVQRAARIFDRVVVGVYRESDKNVLFSPGERLQMVRDSVESIPNASAEAYEGLTAKHAKSIGAGAIVRGLRALSDFEHEFSLSSMNQNIEPEVETVCLLTSREYAFISSSLIREVAALGQSVDHWVPSSVASRIRAKLQIDTRPVSARGEVQSTS